MENPKTQKEVLLLMSVKIDALTETTEKIAKDQFQLSCDFSNYINKTNLRFSEVLNLLESNPKTKKKGAIEQIEINTKDLGLMKTHHKIIYGVAIAIGVISNWIFNHFFE